MSFASAHPTGSAERFLWLCGRGTLSPAQRAALHAAGNALSPNEWASVAELAHPHRLGPLVFTHVSETGLLESVPPAVQEQLRMAYRSALVMNRTLEIEGERALTKLAEHRIDAMMLKGVTLARRFYPALPLRPTSDIDLLVRPQQAMSAIHALAMLGYRAHRGSEHLTSRHALRFQEMRLSNDRSVTVELHTTLVRSPSYRKSLSLREVWKRSGYCPVNGRPVRCLDVCDELTYLCLHYAVQHHAERLCWLTDIAQIFETTRDDWDQATFIDHAIVARTALPVFMTLDAAASTLGLIVPGDALERLRSAAGTAEERRAWAAAHVEFADVSRLSGHLMALPGMRTKLAFAREMIVRGIQLLVGKRE
jgi:hypothetical protein